MNTLKAYFKVVAQCLCYQLRNARTVRHDAPEVMPNLGCGLMNFSADG